jgi:hypothetical protein
MHNLWAYLSIATALVAAAWHCQTKFYTAFARTRAGGSSTVFAHKLPTRRAGFDAENGLYLFALTVPLRLSRSTASRKQTLSVSPR